MITLRNLKTRIKDLNFQKKKFGRRNFSFREPIIFTQPRYRCPYSFYDIRRISFFPLFFFKLLSSDSNYFQCLYFFCFFKKSSLMQRLLLSFFLKNLETRTKNLNFEKENSDEKGIFLSGNQLYLPSRDIDALPSFMIHQAN